MATVTKTDIFDIADCDELIKELEDAQSAYQGAEEQALAASYIFTWFGMIGGPGVACVTATLLTGAFAYYYDTVEDSIAKTISELENYKDFLQNHSNYDCVKMEVTGKIKTVDGEDYWLPSDFNAIALHTGSGWVTL
ncbi:MAG: hypothetical protein N4A68_15355 [Maledivibacter sp.]|jgi:hypothetical protein|nr:hypothetical protein [Maledivibacter sp.]